MRASYRYQGQIIESDFNFSAIALEPEGLPSSPDLSVYLDQYPEASKLEALPGGWIKGPGVFGFYLKNIGRFTVDGGRRIYLEPEAEADSVALEQYLLGTVFAIAQMQRERFCLHAAVVAKQGQVIAFCGDSGEGKSTLAMTMSLKGWEVLTDDLALVVRDSGFWAIHNNGRHIRLLRESIAALGLSSEGLMKMPTLEDKFFIRAPLEASAGKLPLQAICFMESSPEPTGFSLESLTGMPAIAALRQHTYRSELLPLLGGEGAHLRFSCALAGDCRLFRFRRPRSLERLAEMADFLGEQTVWT